MDETEFLRTVVPWTDGGYATIHWQILGNKTFYGRSFRDIGDAIKLVGELRAQGNINIYFCLSRQRFNGGKRSRAWATGIKVVCFDIDIALGDPKKYATPAEAIAAVLRFCIQMRIPKPSLMVLSGGGLHVYWLSAQILTIEDWQPFAEALKNAAKIASLLIDGVVTGDAARVLRVPNTPNLKYDPPRLVRVLDRYSTCEAHDFAAIFADLLKLAPAGKPLRTRLGPVPDAFKDIPITPLGRGIEELPPPSWAAIKIGCSWLREAYETGGKDYDQPQWNLTTLCAIFLGDKGNELAHKFADKHPEYTHESTEGLWDRKIRERRDKNLGWPGCRTISDSSSRHCKLCPHFSLGKSPLHLGYGVTDNASSTRAGPSQADEKDQTGQANQESSKEDSEDDRKNEDLTQLGGRRPKEARYPEGFCFDDKDRTCAHIAAQIDKNDRVVAAGRLMVLIKSQIIGSPTLHYKNGEYSVSFTVKTDRDGEQEVLLTNAEMHSRTLLFPALGKKSVRYNTDPKVADMTVQFTSSWIDLLSIQDNAARDSGTMGWRHEEGKKTGFAYGNTLYRENGTLQPLAAAGDDEFRKWYMPVGKKEIWLKACKLLTDRKRPELDILIALGFAAPLMSFTGALYGSILSVWGEPGTSKSTAQQVAAAIWGHPKQTRESLNSTPKSVQRRLGLTRNLAGFWDDIQDTRHQENLFQTIFVTAEGTEGGRLNTDASMKARLDWQTLLVACSNASFVEYLIKKQKSTTAGMRRVFEFEFNRDKSEPGIINPLDASKVFGALEHNYGAIGAEYAQLLATKHRQVDVLVDSVTKKFTANVDGSAEESYWWSLCGVLLVGAMLARQLGVEIDVRAMDAFLQTTFKQNRSIRGTEGTDGGSLINTEHALSAFMNHYVSKGHALYVHKMFEHRNKLVQPVHSPLEGRQVFVQFAIVENRVFISKRELRDYLQEKEIQVRQVFDGLATFYKAKDAKIVLGGGTVHAQTQETCFEIRVPNDPKHILREMMDAQGPPKHPDFAPLD